MDKYQQLAMTLTPIEEKDLILFNISPEEKSRVVRQYNRALVNAQGDGTDVAQIFLKPLITQYSSWGDTALIFGLCLAREGQFERAEQSLEYAINNTLGSESNLTVAQSAIRSVREDIKNPELRREAAGKGRSRSSMVSSGDSSTARSGMQAPILMRASSKPAKIQMASDKERRDVMMRSASGGDELPSDDINMENVRTAGEKMRLTVRVIGAIVIAAAIFLLVWFVIIPGVLKLRSADDLEERNDFLVDRLNENKADPVVAEILAAYAEEFEDVDADKVTSPESTPEATEEGTESQPDESSSETEGTTGETTPSDTTETEPDIPAPVIGGDTGETEQTGETAAADTEATSEAAPEA